MQVKKATTHEELLDVYRLRYKVYCLERGYERPDEYPDGLETDEYDPYSVHFIAYVDSLPVGTVRLILPNPLGFPVERYCKADLKAICFDAGNIAEISRLAVSSDAARGMSIDRSKITLALIRELYHVSRELKVGYIVSAMSRSLERLLGRCGIRFMKAGLPVDYHGIRTPYFTVVEEFEKELFNKRKDIFELFFPAFASS